MGLDIYAGTLTRYYARNWKTVVEQWAEENGYRYSRIGSNEEEGDQADPAVIAAGVHHWQEVILGILHEAGCTCSSWLDDNKKPYYTDKPDFDAYGALLLYAACRIYDEPVPAYVQKGWDYHENPLILRAVQDEELRWSLFAGAEWWLPWESAFFFCGQDPLEQERTMATVEGLQQELNIINSLGWQADEETILTWVKTEGYPADGEMRDGEVVTLEEKTEYDMESLAKLAFSILYQAAMFSKKHSVPILMDY